MNLNSEQKQAVFTDSKNVLVNAGAGSGKTRALTSRIEHLIKDKKVSPYEILTLTFTRAAAREMTERLKETIGNDVYKLHIGTMHALGLQYIRRFGEALGIHPKTVTVYSEWESAHLLKGVCTDLGVYNGKQWKIPKKDIDLMFSFYYSSGVEPDDGHCAYTIFHAFMQRCRENNALTYGGLIHGFYLILAELKKHLHIRHILVDEVQDIDRLQHLIISVLQMNFDASVFMTGDISQSIFEWRGAKPSQMMILADHCDVFNLANNYRSKSDIVEASNRLIENNALRIPLNMKAFRESESVNIFVQKDTDSQKTVKSIQVMTASGTIQKKDIVVLARNHGLLKKLSSLLDEANIKHQYVGRKSELIHSESFRRFIAFLKLMVNPQDNFSFLLIRDFLGLSRKEYNEIRKISVENGISHFDAWYNSESLTVPIFETFNHWKQGGFNEFDDILNSLTLDLIHLDLTKEVEFIKSSACTDIKQFLDWVTTYDISEEATEGFEGLRLMTIHGAKGLEFPMVILAGCNETILPSSQAIKSNDIEAERRLMYVAMTRAQDKLIFCVRPEKKELKSGKIDEAPISRFIDEALR